MHFKKKDIYRMLQMPDFQVSATGFEPVTVCLEGRCSIQLSYAPDIWANIIHSGKMNL